MDVTSIGGHTRPDCNARYDVRIKLVEKWLFVCLTWRGNVGRLFVMVLHVVLTPMKSWTLIGQFRSRGLNTRFWLVVPPSSDYYYYSLSRKFFTISFLVQCITYFHLDELLFIMNSLLPFVRNFRYSLWFSRFVIIFLINIVHFKLLVQNRRKS